MKLGLDTRFVEASGFMESQKRATVPKEFVGIALETLRQLGDIIQAFELDNHIELIRVRFGGTEDVCTMTVTLIAIIRLHGLHGAQMREDVDVRAILRKDMPMADAAGAAADAAGTKIRDVLEGMLTECKSKKIRYHDGDLIVAP